jgi:hypothetical protein
MWRLELTEMLDTQGLLTSKPLPHDFEGRPRGRTGASAAGETPTRGHPACPRGDRQRGADLSLQRDQPPDLLQLVPPLRGARPRRSQRSIHKAPCEPGATSSEIVAKIVYLRSNYHFGPQKIQMYLKRYHDITLSVSGIWRVLKRLDMNRLPSSQRYKRYRDRWTRYEKPQPGHRVQIDVKFIAPPKGSRRGCYYQFTAIDDCTRLRVLRLYDRLNQKTAIQFVDYALERLPFRVDVIQTDIQTRWCPQIPGPSGRRDEDRRDRRPPTAVADRTERSVTPCLLIAGLGGGHRRGAVRPVGNPVTGSAPR